MNGPRWHGDDGLSQVIAAAVPDRKRPAVLQVLPALGASGGVERGAVEVAAALAAAGWRPVIASAGGPRVREAEQAGAVHVTMPLDRRRAILANALRLARLIEAEGIDIVHARSRAPAWSAWLAARRTRRRFVTTFHGTYGLGVPGKRAYNRIMTRGDRVIAISRFIAEHIRAEYGVGDDRVRLVPRGVDGALFDPERVTPERRQALSESWRLDGRPVVMLPGRLTRWKGQAVLIAAMALLGRDDVLCLLVGDDQGRDGYRAELEAAIVGHGLQRSCRIVGSCADMPAAYLLADIVVSASTDPEAFGRVAIEAQAMGRPVIATGHGGATETVLPGVTGWLVPPGDAAALAAALRTALALPAAERDRLAMAARGHVLADYTTAAMCERTLAVYRELLP